jgi:hypothetical protein
VKRRQVVQGLRMGFGCWDSEARDTYLGLKMRPDAVVVVVALGVAVEDER